jgi:hypothetical protein
MTDEELRAAIAEIRKRRLTLASDLLLEPAKRTVRTGKKARRSKAEIDNERFDSFLSSLGTEEVT